MAINTRTEYALRALIEMVDKREEAISAREICQRQELPKKYVEHLLSGLKGAGLITSSPGSHGGYVLAVKPSDINIATVMDAVGDNSLDPACTGGKDSFCLGSPCGLSSVFNKLSKDLRKVLSSYTLEDFHAGYTKQTSKGKK